MGFSFQPQSQGCAGYAFLIFFTVFWCGITGVFVGFLGHGVYRTLDAQRRFAETQGTVLRSGVATHTDSEGGTSHRFEVRYRYEVGGQAFEADRYAFGAMGSDSGSGSRRAGSLAASLPSGTVVRVYYDPHLPSRAVLSRTLDPTLAFLFLFLQPFILIGLGMLAGCVSWPLTRRAFDRFIHAADTPSAIPSWGRIVRTPHGFLVRPHLGLAGVIGAAAAGYGLCCFLSVFVVGIVFGGFSHPRLPVVGAALAVAVAVGLASAVYVIRRTARKLRVEIDHVYRRIVLVRQGRTEEYPFRDVAGWVVTRIENPRFAKAEGAPPRVPVLSIRKTTDEDIPVHVFEATEQAPVIAAKCAEILARLTDNKPVLATLDPSDDAPVAPTVAAVLDALKKARAKAREMKDLT
jgi:hypothetical protein